MYSKYSHSSFFPGAETSKMKESVMNSIKTDKENINKQMKDIEKTVQV